MSHAESASSSRPSIRGIADAAAFLVGHDLIVRALIVEDREQITYIAIDTLIYIESIGKKQLAHIVGREQPIELRKQMQQPEGELTGRGFLRIHKGYLVNYRFIRKICEADVILSSDARLPVSRRRLTDIREEYMELMQAEGALLL